MLGYASPSPVASRRFSPTGVAVIIAVHVFLLALVASNRMQIASKGRLDPIQLIRVNLPLPPPPPADPAPRHVVRPVEQAPQLTPVYPIRPLPSFGEPLDPGPVTVPTDAYGGKPVILDPPPLPRAVVRRTATLLTADEQLRPPYPASKQRLGEEASLSLRLTIAADGRVTQVESVGAADPVFLAAARRHIMAHWHYRAASEDGSAVASTLVVQLSFKLDQGG